ncbi:MAG: helix-turn-helix domain-containing protein [Clostridia bacterium]|nr:helix-turn-helix domain-containing protein [Clostridia bacterium]MBR2289658.1 helix-turn-helix domain-containing protein [Clostridia bacterium]
MKKFDGIWIPYDILTDTHLSDKQKIILSIALYFSQQKTGCIVGNEYLAKLLNITDDRISKLVSSLKKKGYVDVILNRKHEDSKVRKREIVVLKDELIKKYHKSSKQVGENNYLSSEKQLDEIGKKDGDIINNNTNKYIRNNGKQFQGYTPYRDSQYENIDWSKYYKNY